MKKKTTPTTMEKGSGRERYGQFFYSWVIIVFVYTVGHQVAPNSIKRFMKAIKPQKSK